MINSKFGFTPLREVWLGHRAVAQACAGALESIFPMVSEFVANNQ